MVPGGLAVLFLEGNDTEASGELGRECGVGVDIGGHGGGDYAIMYELIRYLNGEGSSVSITKLDDSIFSHLVVYAAEESRKTARVVKFND